MTDLSTLRFFRTPAHSCSYLEDRQASTLFVDHQAKLSPELYSELSLLGFRRSGDYLYRPHCEGCNACIPARVRVADFQPRRRHRRIEKTNRDLTVHREPARYTREFYNLYAAYIDQRHGDGDMYPPSEEQFTNFLTCDWADTHWQIRQCHHLELPYLYLGYWIDQCQKMAYKSQYQPLEILRSGAWKEFKKD